MASKNPNVLRGNQVTTVAYLRGTDTAVAIVGVTGRKNRKLLVEYTKGRNTSMYPGELRTHPNA